MKKKFFRSIPEFVNKEEIILRDYLALERTRLANERTLFAYIRTSLYLFLGGFTLLQVDGLGNLGWIGTLSLVFSLIILLIGALRYQQLRKRLKSYYLKRDSELK